MTMNEICEKYSSLIYSLAIRFKKKWNYIPWTVEDLAHESLIHIFEKQHLQKEERGDFSKFVVSYVIFHLLRITKRDRMNLNQKSDRLLEDIEDKSCHFKFGKLSEKAELYLDVISKMPDGLISFLDKQCFNKRGGHKIFRYAVGKYVGLDHEEVNQIKQEMVDQFLI